MALDPELIPPASDQRDRVTQGKVRGGGLRDWLASSRPRHLVAFAGIALLLLVLDEFTGTTRPFERLAYLVDRGVVRAAVYVVAALLITTTVLLLLRARSRVVSLATAFILTLGTALELGFNLFTQRGFASDYVDITLRELRMTPQAIKAYAEPRLFLILILVVLFWIGAYWLVRRQSLCGPRVPTSLVLILTGGLLIFSAGWRLRFDHFLHYPSFTRPFFNVTAYYVQQQLLPDRITPPVPLTGAPTVVHHLVLMVDEAIRPDLMSLNGYERPTTPYLDSIQDRLINFGTAVSGSTCSHNSNLMLNSFVRTRDMDEWSEVMSRPTIFYFAKRAGYRTVFMSAVFRSPLFYGIRKSDLDDIDDIIMINRLYDDDTYLNDHRLVTELAKVFAQYADERIFVYVRKQGTHFPFDDYYPDAERHFTPVLGSARPMHAHPARLLNSYLNGVRWNVDRFYEALDAAVPQPEAVYLFTSDHGEHVELDAQRVLHCGDHPTMAMVPLWMDVRGDQTRRRFEAAFGTSFIERNRNRASHMNIFPTLLTLMNVETAEPTLFDDLSDQVRSYHPGGPHGTFRTVPFDERDPAD